MSGLPRKKCTPKCASRNRAEHKTVQTRHDKTNQKENTNTESKTKASPRDVIKQTTKDLVLRFSKNTEQKLKLLDWNEASFDEHVRQQTDEKMLKNHFWQYIFIDAQISIKEPLVTVPISSRHAYHLEEWEALTVKPREEGRERENLRHFELDRRSRKTQAIRPCCLLYIKMIGRPSGAWVQGSSEAHDTARYA